MKIIQEEMKYHTGIDLREVDCQGNAICVGGHELRVGCFEPLRIVNAKI